MANAKRFDVKRGISVNGLPFVDENRNVIVGDLTVRGTSTIVDTRTITSVDPIISLGASGKEYTAESITVGTPTGRIKFPAEAFADIAVGDAIKYSLGAGATAAAGLTADQVYFVQSKESDVTNFNYRTITLATTQGGNAIAITGTGTGDQKFTLNPLRDLDQDLGIAFNYVKDTPKTGFFGYRDATQNFTFLLEATAYAGSDGLSDTSIPSSFTGTKAGVEVAYVKLEPTAALTTSTPAIDIDQTWNNVNTIFKAFEIDITDTASSSSSNLLDISIDPGTGSVPRLLLRKDGALAINSSSYGAAFNVAQGSIAEDTLIKGSATWNAVGTTFYGIDVAITDTAYAAGSKLLRLDAGAGQNLLVDITGEIDSTQTWNASGTTFTGIDLQVTNTASAAESKLVNFYSSASRYFSVGIDGKTQNEVEFTGGTSQTALRVDVTDTSSTAGSLLLDLQVGGESRFSVDKNGNIIVNGSGNFEDYIDIQTQKNSADSYLDNTRLQTSYVTIPVGTTTATPINTFDKTVFVTGKYLIQIKQNSNYHSAEVLLIHDGASTAYMTEYGTIWNSAALGELDASISGNNVNLTFTPTAATVAANAEVQVRITRLSMIA